MIVSSKLDSNIVNLITVDGKMLTSWKIYDVVKDLL